MVWVKKFSDGKKKTTSVFSLKNSAEQGCGTFTRKNWKRKGVILNSVSVQVGTVS
jgi:hypothetical protein